jgi:hypothetical protein
MDMFSKKTKKLGYVQNIIYLYFSLALLFNVGFLIELFKYTGSHLMWLFNVITLN